MVAVSPANNLKIQVIPLLLWARGSVHSVTHYIHVECTQRITLCGRALIALSGTCFLVLACTWIIYTWDKYTVMYTKKLVYTWNVMWNITYYNYNCKLLLNNFNDVVFVVKFNSIQPFYYQFITKDVYTFIFKTCINKFQF